MVNSGFLDGMRSRRRRKLSLEYMEKNGLGEKKVNYKLRDWVFSRQRYWVNPSRLCTATSAAWWLCRKDQLPVTLPMVDNYEPTDSGESPCPSCMTG